jgi:polar amino acid transport system ATP-binding protein
MLKINRVAKAFGSHAILKDITLCMNTSEIVGLAGSSGSGKSTLLRIIQGLEVPDTGSIESHARTGFMFQDFQLFPHMTVWENVVYAVTVGTRYAGWEDKARNLMMRLGLSSKANSYPHHLSGGQKQRVALARTLMIEPDILLCDEPTSGLDVATIDDVIELIESVRLMGVSIVIASHDLDFLTKVADTIYVLQKGHLTAQVNPKEMDNPVGYLKNLYYHTD